MFNTSTTITQDTIRLTGYACSRPDTKKAKDGEFLSWQYYRRDFASDLAAHVSVDFNRKEKYAIIGLVSYDPIGRHYNIGSWKEVRGTLDDIVAMAAESLDVLKGMPRHEHEVNRAASLLYDNGFLPGDEGEGDSQRYWIRHDAFSADTWHIIRPASKDCEILDPNDPCEINLGAIPIGAWTSVHCPSVCMAIGMLDSGFVPRSKKPGFTVVSFDEIMGVNV